MKPDKLHFLSFYQMAMHHASVLMFVKVLCFPSVSFNLGRHGFDVVLIESGDDRLVIPPRSDANFALLRCPWCSQSRHFSFQLSSQLLFGICSILPHSSLSFSCLELLVTGALLICDSSVHASRSLLLIHPPVHPLRAPRLPHHPRLFIQPSQPLILLGQHRTWLLCE